MLILIKHFSFHVLDSVWGSNYGYALRSINSYNLFLKLFANHSIKKTLLLLHFEQLQLQCCNQMLNSDTFSNRFTFTLNPFINSWNIEYLYVVCLFSYICLLFHYIDFFFILLHNLTQRFHDQFLIVLSYYLFTGCYVLWEIW